MALGLLSACGGGGSDGDTETTNATDEFGTDDEVGTDAETTESAGTGTDAETTEADTDAETTDADTDAETTDADTDAETTDADTDAETGETGETGNAGCGEIDDADECAAADGCQPVTGSPLKENGPDSPCLEASEFLGCIPQQGCDDALTWFCQGNGTYQVPNSCGPDGFEPCDGPAEPVEACP